jgi:hypothetical protein
MVGRNYPRKSGQKDSWARLKARLVMVLMAMVMASCANTCCAPGLPSGTTGASATADITPGAGSQVSGRTVIRTGVCSFTTGNDPASPTNTVGYCRVKKCPPGTCLVIQKKKGLIWDGEWEVASADARGNTSYEPGNYYYDCACLSEPNGG